MELGIDTRLVILTAGLMFLWALLLGVLKYRQILASPDWAAHPYTDIAHRAALLYSFALMLIAVFVDDMSKPALQATDSTLQSGRVGLGSFDETGQFKNVVVRAN